MKEQQRHNWEKLDLPLTDASASPKRKEPVIILILLDKERTIFDPVHPLGSAEGRRETRNEDRYTRSGISTYSAAAPSRSWMIVGEPGSDSLISAVSPESWPAMSNK
jgi:hypothetical protein